jgi:DNA-binding MarR family transcriptional regulator
MNRPRPTQTERQGAGALSLNVQLCFALYSTLLGVNKIYRKLLRQIDLTYPQYLVMLVLWERDHVNVSEICDQLYLETTTLTPLLKRLEARGLIRRERSAADERQVIVTLTKEGRALREKAKPIPECVAEAVGCSMKDISDLRQRLVKMRTSLFKAAA